MLNTKSNCLTTNKIRTKHVIILMTIIITNVICVWAFVQDHHLRISNDSRRSWRNCFWLLPVSYKLDEILCRSLTSSHYVLSLVLLLLNAYTVCNDHEAVKCVLWYFIRLALLTFPVSVFPVHLFFPSQSVAILRLLDFQYSYYILSSYPVSVFYFLTLLRHQPNLSTW